LNIFRSIFDKKNIKLNTHMLLTKLTMSRLLFTLLLTIASIKRSVIYINYSAYANDLEVGLKQTQVY
jgi:hypothetical protein